MKIGALSFLACPVCKGGLLPSRESINENGEIISGWLACDACKVAYSVENGVPNLLSIEADGVSRIRWVVVK